MAVTITQLRAFLALMRTGSVWAAADELVVTQPSVSAALHTERDGRGIRPSAAGEAFAPYAAHVVGLLEEGRRAVAEAVEAGERELRIVAVTTAAEHIVPALLRAFAAEHPDVRLAVEVANRERVFRRFHRLDAARSSPGTGLGLALAKAIADLHGMSIDLSDNAPGLRVTVAVPRP